MVGSIKTTLIEMFYEHYVVVTEVVSFIPIAFTVVIRLQGRASIYYHEFGNMKAPEFDGVKDPIVDMRWVSDVEGFFYTGSWLANQKVKFALNLLRLGAKDWWKFATQGLSNAERIAMTSEKVTMISNMFIERAFFCPEYAALEHTQML